jgi:hypothetical protein
LHHCGVIVAGDGAGVVDAKRVEGVGERCSGFDGIERSLENDIFGWDCIDVLPADGAEEGDVV